MSSGYVDSAKWPLGVTLVPLNTKISHIILPVINYNFFILKASAKFLLPYGSQKCIEITKHPNFSLKKLEPGVRVRPTLYLHAELRELKWDIQKPRGQLRGRRVSHLIT